ncbi:MAG TPA: flagellar biosynthesis anti-sigma factor FlgM [Acidocella sp.]|nr:flagellar biosynthesis anti-sigma factor FlgM [Acidocella sp.]
MTNTISPFSQTPMPAETNASGTSTASTKPLSSAPSAGSAAPPPQSEAVTLSAAAQTTTQLLSAARESNGINQTAVQQIRSALQAGTYNVTPETLAKAIATVLKESK